MSCGSAGPSTMTSPLLTTWPSCAITCLSFGIRYSCATASGSVITKRCLPLVSLPKETEPVTSASTPASFGDLASNSSATRSEEHTSELQSPDHLVCRLLLEKKKQRVRERVRRNRR